MDFSEILEETVCFLNEILPSNIKIVKEIKDSNLMIRAQKTLLHQVIVNLSTNARDAMADKGGILKFAVEKERKVVKGEKKEFLKFTVEDNGCGMDEETKRRIFDPFFTTKEQGKGTGLGMTTVFNIVKSFDGFVEVESEVNKGTRVYVYFPLVEDKKSFKDDFDDKKEQSYGGKRVLFLDDEEDIVNSMKEGLESLGFEVFGFTSPKSALEFVMEKRNEIDVIITDKTMPEMDGMSFGERVKKFPGNIPMIILTGYSDDFDEKKQKKLVFQLFFTNPSALKNFLS